MTSLLGSMGEVFNLQVRLSLENQQFLNALQATGTRMRAVGRTLTTALTLPIVGLGINAVRMAANFEQAMNQVAAVTQGTAEEMELLNSVAQELGRTTKFSATQAAEGMNFLAMAGFEVNEIAAAMPDVLNLAAAANMDLAEAADIASNILTGMGMPVEELGHAMDVMAGTFTSANTNLVQLGEAMRYAAPVATAFGLSFEETSAILGMFGNAGIQASMAGTSLRQGLVRLIDVVPSAQVVLDELGVQTVDAENNFRGMTQVLIDLSRAFDEKLYTSTQRGAAIVEIFGVRAGPAMINVLNQGTEELEKFTAALGDVDGLAANIAETQMQGLNGQLIKLQSAFEGLMIAIGETGLLEALTEFAEKLTAWVSGLAEADPAMIRLGLVIAGVVAALGPLLMLLGQILTVAPAIGVAFTAMTGPWGILVAAIIAGVALIVKNWDWIVSETKFLQEEVLRWMEPIKAWFLENLPLIRQTWITILTAIQDFWNTWGPTIMAAWNAVWEVIKVTAFTIWDTIKAAFEILFHTLGGLLEAGMHIINGDWDLAWQALLNTVIDIVNDIYEWFTKIFNDIATFTDGWKDRLIDLFYNLGVSLVFGSIVPEMLEAMKAVWFKTLEEIEERIILFNKKISDPKDPLFMDVTKVYNLSEKEGPGKPRKIRGTGREHPIKSGTSEVMDSLNDAIIKGFSKLGRSIVSGNISKTIQNIFNDLGKILEKHISTRITANIGGGGLFGSIVGAFGGGIIGAGISLLGGLLGGGKKKMPGSDMNNLSYTFISNWEDFFQFGFTLPSSFVLSGRSDRLAVDPHGRVLDYSFGGWENGEHFDS